MAEKAAPGLTTEKVAYWYFRLNGYLQMENFIVHPDRGKGGQRTDADLIGVRFPHRAERLIGDPGNIMSDDVGPLGLQGNWIDVVLVEVKTSGPCKLNGPWTNQDAENVQRVLAAVGCFPTSRLDEIAESIYDEGIFEDAEQMLRVRLIALAATESEELRDEFPRVVQLNWNSVLSFIGNRLYDYRSAKSDCHQWDDEIKTLQAMMKSSRSGHNFDEDQFIKFGLKALGVHSD
ncbi:hypothetical protein JQX09_24280 [Sulfitobacter pseudonitzschiae]|uniref:Uncharacterized protein n=1 Tax=Pseudosulfitobacter pseudonitzschiae TaxID=1402135 RepID=A0A9Q2NRH8_9RHOB|nr:hypothetical protein [Pseudosulfitobacter pseudonitzschiae]MBM2295041.1 hypothetical protein [Pseudosulfitobacter pseudonitzschiae]MBM2299955.1 hypothetical protein [Pseudosulfitobacter pseudonitzschiae]MBM2304879.1 hypothetical protein [Pseudosulfitobacter pseudonitzschiae]MBM2314652.1 hypothetical protein [Pseudosulfitobacter pseudonitzschiae]MBM2319562.1 hypothetical protein [Pseudosulfitobacter pseudonitzschiae]